MAAVAAGVVAVAVALAVVVARSVPLASVTVPQLVLLLRYSCCFLPLSPGEYSIVFSSTCYVARNDDDDDRDNGYANSTRSGCRSRPSSLPCNYPSFCFGDRSRSDACCCPSRSDIAQQKRTNPSSAKNGPRRPRPELRQSQ